MAQFPSQSSASDIWSLTDVSRAIQGQNWPLMGDFDSISTVTVGAGGTGTITFSSIPTGYKHLQLRFMARGNRAAVGDYAELRFNSDSSSLYNWHTLYGTGSSALAYTPGSSVTLIDMGEVSGASANASVFGVGITDILDYADTNKFKTLRSISGFDNNGNGEISLFSGVWRSTNAISTITITPQGTLFNQYSQFALYGIKG